MSLNVEAIMNPKISLLIFPLLILASGCSTRVSSTHGYSHHNHVSVGVHGRSSGAALVGALIVGGIIGSIINENDLVSKLLKPLMQDFFLF